MNTYKNISSKDGFYTKIDGIATDISPKIEVTTCKYKTFWYTPKIFIAQFVFQTIIVIYLVNKFHI